jgi:hypothetical protein
MRIANNDDGAPSSTQEDQPSSTLAAMTTDIQFYIVEGAHLRREDGNGRTVMGKW